MSHLVTVFLIGLGLLIVSRYWNAWRDRGTSAPRFRVSVDDVGVSCVGYQGETRSIAWKELGAVGITTTDDGPLEDDFLWGLHDRDGQVRLVIPSDAAGNEALLHSLQALPGFDNDQVILAMGSTSNAHFPCWKGSVEGRPLRESSERHKPGPENPGV